MRFLGAGAIWLLAAAVPVALAAPMEGHHSLLGNNAYDDTARGQQVAEHVPSSGGAEEADKAIFNLLSKENMYDDSGDLYEDEDEEKSYLNKPTDVLSERKPIPTTVLMKMTENQESDEAPPSRPTPSKSFSRVLPASYSLSGKDSTPDDEQKKPCSSSLSTLASKSGMSENPGRFHPVRNFQVASTLDWISNRPSPIWTVIPILLIFLMIASIVIVEVVMGVWVFLKARRVLGFEHPRVDYECRGHGHSPCNSISSRIRLRGSEQKLCAVASEKGELTCVDPA